MASLPTARRIALVVEYEGTNYAGFQLQAADPTIQGEIEKALFRLTGEHIRIRGASRTDSGAHALGQVVDLSTQALYPAETFVNALNYYLPVDIRVVEGRDVQYEFDARRDAQSRVYRYLIWNRGHPPALYRKHCHWIREPLAVQGMNEAAQYLVGVHDFRAFAPGHPADRSAVRQVHRWDVTAGQEIRDTIAIACEANGFMQHQIRRTNAVLVEVGKGNLPADCMAGILGDSGNNLCAEALDSIATLPARGLCLVEVKYRNPWSEIEGQNETK